MAKFAIPIGAIIFGIAALAVAKISHYRLMKHIREKVDGDES